MLLLFVQVKYELGVAKRETVKREVIFEMQPIFLDYLVFSIYSSFLPIIFKLFLQVYDYMEQNKTFVFSHTLSDIIWGGSDTCQVAGEILYLHKC